MKYNESRIRALVVNEDVGVKHECSMTHVVESKKRRNASNVSPRSPVKE